MYKKKQITILIFTFLTSTFINAQNDVISIWENEIPGSINNVAYSEKKIKNEDLTEKVNQITTPTLLIFKPKTQNSNKPAILICPGGGYAHLSIDKEGKKVAAWLNSLGITAFVLKYRLPSDLIMKNKTIGPLQDAQKAIRLIRKNYKEWNIAPNNIGIIGFSAGGHLAATLSTHYNENTYETKEEISARPDFTILAYPVISMKSEITHKGSQTNLLGSNPTEIVINEYSNELWVTTDTPPAFIIHASDDKSVPVENSIRYFSALNNSNIPVELHIYEKGGHGLGLGVNDTSKLWTTDCENWLKSQKIISSENKK